MLSQNQSYFDRSDDERTSLVETQHDISEIVPVNLDIEEELNRLEDLILESPRVPIFGQTLVDEEQLLKQLDLIRVNLPDAFRHAVEIMKRRRDIIKQAEVYAQEIIDSAQKRADRMTDRLEIIQQAQQEASQIKRQVQEECDEIRQQTIEEIQEIQKNAQQESDKLRQQVMTECQEIQIGADEYAGGVLDNLEEQLSLTLKIIRNGRQQLEKK
jgi:cell division septum initiation protein DivIVA